MKPLLPVLAVALLACDSAAVAEEFKSGLQVGENCGCLQVEWVVGWPYKDQFSGKFGPGCMTCTLAPASLVAIIFIQKVDDNVANLVRAMDPKVTGWLSNEGPKAFVCAVGKLGHDDLKPLDEVSTNVALTVAARGREWQKNLDKYKLNDAAAVTVIVYGQQSKVVANFAFRDTKDLDKERVAEIVKVLRPEPAK
ncbi:MAG TPA: hypothetical protein VKE40_07815 [Gemmataceae bacterium]|nr:hypothetical protein [Gemmataceae bacterium]